MKDGRGRHAEGRVDILGTPIAPVVKPPQKPFVGIEDVVLSSDDRGAALPPFSVDILSSHINMVEATLRADHGLLIPIPSLQWLTGVKLHDDGSCTGVLPGQEASDSPLLSDDGLGKLDISTAPSSNGFIIQTECWSISMTGSAQAVTDGLRQMRFIGNQHYNGNFSLTLKVT